jgi:hypothetical protein
VIAADRVASLFPLVQSRCTTRSLAAFRLFQLLGYRPILVIGGMVESFEPHMWLEVEGIRVDSGVLDNSLDVFTPFVNA